MRLLQLLAVASSAFAAYASVATAATNPDSSTDLKQLYGTDRHSSTQAAALVERAKYNVVNEYQIITTTEHISSVLTVRRHLSRFRTREVLTRTDYYPRLFPNGTEGHLVSVPYTCRFANHFDRERNV